MGLGYRIALRHRLGLDDLGAVGARLAAGYAVSRWEVGRALTLLLDEPGLDRDALTGLAGALAGRAVDALRWALLDAGLVELARAVPIGSFATFLNALDDRVAAGKAHPPELFDDAQALLAGLDLDADLLLAIQAAKVLGPWLPPARRAALLADLVPRAEADAESGAWDELDYPYGTVDPSLELARALAHGGDEAAVDAQLDARTERNPSFINLEEATEAHRICHRAATWQRFRAWAGDGLDDDGTPGTQVAWLVATLDAPWGDSAQRLEALLPQLAVTGLAAIADGARGRALGDAAEHALVGRAVEAIARIDDADAAIHARALRDTMTAAWTLDLAVSLGDDDQAAIAAAAAVWAGRVAAVDTGDWNPQINTALGFARRWPDAVAPATARLRAESAAGNVDLEYENWARLFDADAVLARLGR